MRIKMKDIIGIIVLFLLLNSTCSMVNLSPHEYEPPQPTSTTEKPWIRLEEVSFNFDPRYNLYDAINIRMNDEEDVKVPEWKRDRDGAPYPAAYIKDREIMIKVKFRAHPSFNKFKIKIRADSTEGVLGNITSQFVSFSKGYSTEQTSIFRIKCRTPKAITTFPQEWDWHCEDVNLPNFNHHIGTSRNKIYILMDEPQHPWSETGNTEPWVEVLDISCNWAKGATTAEDVAGKITRCLYNKTNCFYLVGDNKSKLFKDKGWQLDMNMFTGQKSEYPLNLIRFLKTIPDRQTCVPKKIKYSVLCYDMAKALVSFSNVLGSQLTYRVSKKIGELNCIKPIGRAWTCKDSFGTHAFAGLGDIVFDACLIAGTPQGKYVNEAWMVNIPWNKYKEKIAQNASSPHDPKVYTVAISGVGIEEAEAILTASRKERLRDLRDAFSFFSTETSRFSAASGIEEGSQENQQLIAGLNISSIILDELKGMREVPEMNLWRIRKINNETFSTIRKCWRLGDDFFETEMVVCPTHKKAVGYLKYCYENIPMISPSETLYDPKIGYYYFIAKQKAGYSGIDFIQSNIILRLRDKGRSREDLIKIAKKLADLLIKDKSAESSNYFQQAPIINDIACPKDQIRLGESVDLDLDVINPGKEAWRPFFKVSGGGIKKSESVKHRFIYYGGEAGMHTITITVLNALGLSDSKFIKIEVI